MNQINVDKWAKKDLWTLWEGIFLLLGKEPNLSILLSIVENKYNNSEFSIKFNNLSEIIEASIRRKLLKVYKREINLLFNHVIPSIFLEWAQEKNLLNDQLNSILLERNQHEMIFQKELSNPPAKSIEKKLRPCQINKIACQTIARILWAEDPNKKIADIIKHPYILKIGNGNYYKGKNTLRDWVSEVDPRPADQKTGRPPLSK